MTFFEKRLIREISTVCASVMLLTMGILGIVKFLALLRRAVQGNLPVDGLFSLLFYKLVTYLDVISTPVLFLAILLVFSRWHKDKEVSIFATGGIGPYQYFNVAGFLATAAATLVVVFSSVVSPYAEVHYSNELMLYRQSLSNVLFVPGKFRKMNEGQNVVYFGQENSTDDADSIRLFYLVTKPLDREIIVAGDGRYRDNMEKGVSEIGIFEGSRYKLYENLDAYELTQFASIEETLPLATSESLQQKAEMKSTTALMKSPRRVDRVELYWRISKVITILLVVLYGCGIGIFNLSANVGLHLLIAVTVYFLYSVSLGLIVDYSRDHPQYTENMIFIPHAMMLLVIGWMFLKYKLIHSKFYRILPFFVKL